jgi:acyl carrier protein phosphodiesterase
MNYLAHLYLSEPVPEAWLGSILPDLLRGPVPADLPVNTREHATRHHAVDRFTDSHALFWRSRTRLAASGLRHYTGVVVDVLYDHFLARDWACWASEPLPQFAERVYGGLAEVAPRLAPISSEVCARMRQSDWLNHYAVWDGLATALQRLSRRSRRGARLEVALPYIAAEYGPLADDFHAFFAELRTQLAHPLAVGRSHPILDQQQDPGSLVP